MSTTRVEARGVAPTDELALRVQDFFAENAAEFDLRADALEVRPVFSRGGFVNHSFRVFDGTRTLHLKLAVTPDAQAALDRWFDLGDVLERHRAPPVHGRIAIGTASGLVFPAVPGRSPALSDHVLQAVLGSLRGLWSDGDLAARLLDPTGVTAAACYADTYHDRFTEDLRAIEAEPPPFLTAPDLDFMRGEVTRLRRAVEADPAFDATVASPIHGDLWLDNVLWDGGDSWHIVDWDDVRIGDPALDVATLTGPTPRNLAPLKRFEAAVRDLDPAVVDRVTPLGRASLLDWVIDPLADWIEAGVVGPDRITAVRIEKERIHTKALELYHSLYGDAEAGTWA